MNNTVFSFNRPAQLDLFMRSYAKNMLDAHPINVIYKHSSPLAKEGYAILKKDFPMHNYICENDLTDSFKDLVVDTVADKNNFTTFFVDDIIFINPVKLEGSSKLKIMQERDDILCTSLRLYPGIDYSQIRGMPIKSPELDENLIWDYSNSQSYWGYPMSVDGHVFRTKDIKNLIKSLDFKNPNTFESALSNNPLTQPNMICFPNAILVNNPANKVQTVYANNPSLNISVDELNAKYVAGKRIDMVPFQGISPKSCHEEKVYSFLNE